MRDHGPVRVLIVGQIPPPYHGQAVMIKQLLAGDMGDRLELVHVPMRFSVDLDSIGEITIGKVWQLLRLVVRIWIVRVRTGARILYYPPAGPNMVPIIRDMVILNATRFLFDAVIFHFHAGGVSEARQRLFRPFRWLFDRAYMKPDAAVRMAASTPDDARALKAGRDVIIPYGIPDHAAGRRRPGSPPTRKILSLGLVTESKGLSVLVESCALLNAEGLSFELEIVGAPRSARYLEELRSRIEEMDLSERVLLRGELTGEAKWQTFLAADIFCMPTYYESEAFPVVLLEALNFGLPIVATRWRGIPEIVDEGRNGFLVEPRDPEALAGALAKLLADPDRLEGFGRNARAKYESEFSAARYSQRFRDLFLDAANGWDGGSAHRQAMDRP